MHSLLYVLDYGLQGQTAWAITWGVVTAATVGVTIWLRRGFSEAALNTKPNRVASLAAELGCEDEPAPPAPAKTILLAAFPPGYERGSFRLVPGGVELRAKGKPALFIAEPSDE